MGKKLVRIGVTRKVSLNKMARKKKKRRSVYRKGRTGNLTKTLVGTGVGLVALGVGLSALKS